MVGLTTWLFGAFGAVIGALVGGLVVFFGGQYVLISRINQMEIWAAGEFGRISDVLKRKQMTEIAPMGVQAREANKQEAAAAAQAAQEQKEAAAKAAVEQVAQVVGTLPGGAELLLNPEVQAALNDAYQMVLSGRQDWQGIMGALAKKHPSIAPMILQVGLKMYNDFKAKGAQSQVPEQVQAGQRIL